ncbi:hypothetical protein DFJ58DRAFT_847288 [Suillus subalutaceus]|uniref:uncharacterized protein n=1 Tax=Suillus subalutaceus TaxID=48586 RepID=UPI001B872BB8|nr:uncharacterized protein DFJ58DRAFT_847288 [Suillus subalutaceus]KAG1835919.1 hypothetical protein DFJ58DRAFT_847288 [Suillus subalutaceus]
MFVSKLLTTDMEHKELLHAGSTRNTESHALVPQAGMHPSSACITVSHRLIGTFLPPLAASEPPVLSGKFQCNDLLPHLPVTSRSTSETPYPSSDLLQSILS